MLIEPECPISDSKLLSKSKLETRATLSGPKISRRLFADVATQCVVFAPRTSILFGFERISSSLNERPLWPSGQEIPFARILAPSFSSPFPIDRRWGSEISRATNPGSMLLGSSRASSRVFWQSITERGNSAERASSIFRVAGSCTIFSISPPSRASIPRRYPSFGRGEDAEGGAPIVTKTRTPPCSTWSLKRLA